jgi:hypothetical protein
MYSEIRIHIASFLKGVEPKNQKIEYFYKIKMRCGMTECAICLEDNTPDSILLSCKHCFHKKCINTAVYKFAEQTIDFELHTCPLCRNHLTGKDKQLVITGEQFVWVMQNILFENKKLCMDVYNAYEQLTEEKPPETITSEDIYMRIASYRDGTLEEIEQGYIHDISEISSSYQTISEYNTILYVCKLNFGFA